MEGRVVGGIRGIDRVAIVVISAHIRQRPLRSQNLQRQSVFDAASEMRVFVTGLKNDFAVIPSIISSNGALLHDSFVYDELEYRCPARTLIHHAQAREAGNEPSDVTSMSTPPTRGLLSLPLMLERNCISESAPVLHAGQEPNFTLAPPPPMQMSLFPLRGNNDPTLIKEAEDGIIFEIKTVCWTQGM
ncbi:hypothetical protein BT96DRAFT_1023151 [Gymnopus androsaceus JB14]|uniref:Uncharacterized protein n=1 Tax=Gymnopus androsaceus JB14 TaxID=1447944 RepID=A0A6A4H733_9AGAR|nr:hypothetical protein BT96DRAFT_1023151 [Gymnopus androsaceus JB14]